MAARKVHGAKTDLGNPDQWRKKIQASAILNRLQAFTLGELELSQAQVTAAKILLAKVMPDLSENKTEHTGSVTVVRRSFTRNPNP